MWQRHKKAKAEKKPSKMVFAQFEILKARKKVRKKNSEEKSKMEEKKF